MKNRKIFIIAEAGVNHNGNLELAKQLVKIAADAGADAVKFQTFQAQTLVHKDVKTAAYQEKNLGSKISQYEMLKSLELSKDFHLPLKELSDSLNIEFMSTPFDIDSVKFLNNLGVTRFKIGSGDIANAPYLVEIGRCKKPVILSTGMSDLILIRNALALITFGALNESSPNGLAQALKATSNEESITWMKNNITLLHCVSEYPTPLERVNLLAINSLKNEFKLSTGLSDHSTSLNVAIAAVGMGASVIEKHFTINKKMEGPDHKASLEPNELSEMIQSIRQIELALGDGEKKPTRTERDTYELVGKRIVTTTKVKKGEIFNLQNLSTLRANKGLSAIHYYDLIGKQAIRDYIELDSIEEDYLSTFN